MMQRRGYMMLCGVVVLLELYIGVCGTEGSPMSEFQPKKGSEEDEVNDDQLLAVDNGRATAIAENVLRHEHRDDRGRNGRFKQRKPVRGFKGRKRPRRAAPLDSAESSSTEHQDMECHLHLHPSAGDVHERVKRLIGEKVKNIEYELLFPDYDRHPLVYNASRNYNSRSWKRVNTHHGSALLALAFNYDVLSMSMLKHGVESMAVPLQDSPLMCLQNLSEPERFNVTRQLLMNDFVLHENDLWLEEDDHVCHQVITQTSNGQTEFGYECCSKLKAKLGVMCSEEHTKNSELSILYTALEIARLVFFLFGPLILPWICWRWDVHCSLPYVVHLSKPIKRWFCLSPENDPHDSDGPSMINASCSDGQLLDDTDGNKNSLVQESHDQPMELLRKYLDERGCKDAKFNAAMDRLHLKVDHTELMAQNEVPVGLIRFLYDGLVRCSMFDRDPFRACGESPVLCGKSKFLSDGCGCLLACRSFVWRQCVAFFGWFILMVIIVPLPFHIRVYMFYLYEIDEIERRNAAAQALGIPMPYVQALWLGHDWAGIIIAFYVVYVVMFVALTVLREFVYDRQKFDDKIKDCIHDIRHISYAAIVKMILAHVLFPIQKYGVFFGSLLALIYVPIFAAGGLIVGVFYGVPIVYMMGRLLTKFKVVGILKCGLVNEPEYEKREAQKDDFRVDDNLKSCADLYFFRKISPDKWEFPRLPENTLQPHFRSIFNGYPLCKRFAGALVGVICIVNMVVVVLMYAEAFRFLLEVVCLTVMGVVVNSEVALDMFMFVVWVLIYCHNTFKHVTETYLQLSAVLFKFLKDHLENEIADATRFSSDEQANTAFKYFSSKYLADVEQISIKYCRKGGIGLKRKHDQFYPPSKYEPHLRRCSECNCTRKFPNQQAESTEGTRGELGAWNVTNVVLFVDRNDETRIPKDFFLEVVNRLTAAGCPGPVSQSMWRAGCRLFYMTVILLFIYIIILSFGRSGGSLSSNHLLLALVGGFLPFVMQNLLMPSGAQLDLSSYSLKGKLEAIIFNYQREWPIFDLELKPPSSFDEPDSARKVAVQSMVPPDEDGSDNPILINRNDIHFERRSHILTFGIHAGPARKSDINSV